MDKVLVSVIIPCCNAATWLDECLGSILQQTFLQEGGKIEVSIHDDGSSDNSIEIIQRWGKVLVDAGIGFKFSARRAARPPSASQFSSSPPARDSPVSVKSSHHRKQPEEKADFEVHKGAGHARNRAVLQSSGNFLCFLDADDYMHPHRISLQLKACMSFPDCPGHEVYVGTKQERTGGLDLSDKGAVEFSTKPLTPPQGASVIVGGDFLRSPKDSTPRWVAWLRRMKGSELYTQRFREMTLIQPTWFCSRHVFDTVGGYSPLQKDPEDMLFFYRHLELGGSLCRVSSPVLTYRFTTGSLSWKVKRKTLVAVKAQHFMVSVLGGHLSGSGKQVLQGAASDDDAACLEMRDSSSRRSSKRRKGGGSSGNWDTFTIWGAGKDGKAFYKALAPWAQQRMTAFWDIDPKKVGGFYVHTHDPTKRKIPIHRWEDAQPPLAICVAVDRGTIFEKCVEQVKKNTGMVEGADYFHCV